MTDIPKFSVTTPVPPLPQTNQFGMLKVCLTDPTGNTLSIKDLPSIIDDLREQVPVNGVEICIKDEKGDFVRLTKEMLTSKEER